MSTLERVHIRITKQQADFIRQKYGNISQWVRSRIDREIGADEARIIEDSKGGPLAEEKQKPPQKVTAWNFPK
jgi:hypothetical protein